MSVKVWWGACSNGDAGNVTYSGTFTESSVPARPIGVSAAQDRGPSGSDSSDPVNTVDGNYTYDHTDLAIPGRGSALVFARAQ